MNFLTGSSTSRGLQRRARQAAIITSTAKMKGSKTFREAQIIHKPIMSISTYICIYIYK